MAQELVLELDSGQWVLSKRSHAKLRAVAGFRTVGERGVRWRKRDNQSRYRMAHIRESYRRWALPRLSRLRSRLLLLVLLPLVPALALTVYTSFKERQIEKDRVQEGAFAIARLGAANQEKFIKNAHQLLETVGSIGFLVNSPVRQFSQSHLINLRLLSPDYLDFGLIESNGVLFCSAENTNGTPNLSKRWDFQLVLQSKRFVVGDFQMGGYTRKPALHFGYPILNTNSQVYRVFYASLNLELLSQAASQISLPAQAAITVFDRSGSIIARAPEPENWIGKSLKESSFFKKLVETREGIFQMTGYDNEPRLYAVAPVSDGVEPALYVAVGIPTAISFAKANQLLLRNSVLLLAVAILALWVTRVYSTRFILEPITALVSAAKQLANGDLAARAGLRPGGGEIDELARTFDDMAEALQKREREIESAHQKISRMNLELEHRVKDRTAQLEKANHELERTNRELEAFSYSVSHDLRAPLRHIDGYTKILEQELSDRLDNDTKQLLGSVTKAARRMEKLIEDLLAFSRTGRQELAKCQVPTARMVDDIVQELAAESERRSIHWQIGDLPVVFADPGLLRQVWANLILNAVKYTRRQEKPKIEIGSASDPGGEHIFFVRDNGVGFDMQYVGKLFGPFQRLHGNKEFEGNGIGLANVYRIITRHGGRVWAQGKMNEGATFYFSLPKEVKV